MTPIAIEWAMLSFHRITSEPKKDASMNVDRQPTSVPLLENQIDRAGHLLARAFQDDPLNIYALPDERERARLNPTYFSAFVRYGHVAGEVWTMEGSLDGVAIWLPPGGVDIQSDLAEQAGITSLPSILGVEPVDRKRNVFDYLDMLHRRDVQGPHWYLTIIGIEPNRQRQGVGSALLQPVLSRADAEGLPCYLETLNATNIPFYARHGFKIVVEDVEPKSGLRFWTFQREPRSRPLDS